MLSTDSLYIARTLFKLKVYQSNGAFFQDLFVKVMQHKYSNFKQVKPQGRIGDKKNDGYRKGEGIFYQIYAPESPIEKDITAATKAISDFDGLYKFWNAIEEVKKYFFAFNDKYLGEYPETRKALSDLEKIHTKIGFDLFVSKHLEDEFMSLDEVKIIDIVGHLPTPDCIAPLGYDALSEAIHFLLSQERDLNFVKTLNVPDIGEKIMFNNLSQIVKSLLENGQFQAYVLEDYFRNNPKKTLRQDLQKVFVQFYEEAKKEYAALILDNNDAIFFQILNRACGIRPESVDIQNAILILMAYFFEHCDIFEEPPKI